MTAHRRDLDVFGTTLHLAFDSRGWGQIRRLAAKHGEQLETWMEMTGIGTTVVWDVPGEQHIAYAIRWNVLEALPEASRVSVIAHEAFHGALSIAEHHHIPTTVANDETTAYLVGWISAWIWSRKP